jgi:hypothetical protein
MAFPAEVLACLRVGEAMGLADPAVEHPFLRNALGQRCQAWLQAL